MLWNEPNYCAALAPGLAQQDLPEPAAEPAQALVSLAEALAPGFAQHALLAPAAPPAHAFISLALQDFLAMPSVEATLAVLGATLTKALEASSY